jgi:SPX domain protein involved in polyphosphate accumulation
MVKFGETIEMDRRPEWIDGYVDYAGLKGLLKKMDAAGTKNSYGGRGKV